MCTSVSAISWFVKLVEAHRTFLVGNLYENIVLAINKFTFLPQGMYLLSESPELWPSQIWFLDLKKFRLEEKFVQMSIILLISYM